MRQLVRLSLCLLLLVGTIGVTTTAWSQDVTAAIVGTVTDPSGAAVTGATVTATSTRARRHFQLGDKRVRSFPYRATPRWYLWPQGREIGILCGLAPGICPDPESSRARRHCFESGTGQ